MFDPVQCLSDIVEKHLEWFQTPALDTHLKDLWRWVEGGGKLPILNGEVFVTKCVICDDDSRTVGFSTVIHTTIASTDGAVLITKSNMLPTGGALNNKWVICKMGPESEHTFGVISEPEQYAVFPEDRKDIMAFKPLPPISSPPVAVPT